jgi:hypothetical protein
MTEIPGKLDESTLASSHTDQMSDDSEYYLVELAKAVEFLSDLVEVNKKIAEKTDRPELLMNSPVDMVAIDWDNVDVDLIDNFSPELTVSGEEIDKYTTPKGDDALELTPDQFVIDFGGRGEESYVYAKDNGIAPGIRTFGYSHLSRPAFVRMWILFPDLTKKIMKNLEPRSLGVEVQVAYEIMSRLVDASDPLTEKSDKSIDDRYLTR